MSGAAVRVRVLGPLRALADDGADLTPAGPLQRRLLALLVARRGHVVTVDAAVDALWPDAPPRDPAGALQNHLSRLRQSLPAGAIESVGEGYRLDPSCVEVDSDDVPALLDAASTGDPDALAALRDLLAEWHDPALPELGDVDDGRTASARPGELRRRAREVVAEQRLARGDTDGLVAELSALAGAEPLRERPQELLMAALARAGRRVDALRAFDDFRRRLGDELGIERRRRWSRATPPSWRRAGMWSTQWTMLRSIAGLLARLDRPRDAAVLLGAIRATGAGHRIFGDDRVALAELERRLREALGEDGCSAAFAEGAVLEGDAAVEHALRSLGGPALTSGAARPAHRRSPSPPARG